MYSCTTELRRKLYFDVRNLLRGARLSRLRARYLAVFSDLLAYNLPLIHPTCFSLSATFHSPDSSPLSPSRTCIVACPRNLHPLFHRTRSPLPSLSHSSSARHSADAVRTGALADAGAARSAGGRRGGGADATRGKHPLCCCSFSACSAVSRTDRRGAATRRCMQPCARRRWRCGALLAHASAMRLLCEVRG